MKFLVIVAGITALGLCRSTVKVEEASTIDQIRNQARQIHKQFDSNRDGHVSLEEIGEGIMKGVGLLDADEGPSYTRQLYEKYISGKDDKSKYLIEEDFEEIFTSRDKNYKSLLAQAQEKAKQIYASLDSDKSGDITLEEIMNKIKEGLNLGIEEDGDNQKSLSDKISALYDKYVKSDQKNSKGFTEEDVSDIVMSKLKKGKRTLEKSASNAKDAASDAVDAAVGRASELKDAAAQKAKDLKDAAGDAANIAAEKASELKDAAAKKAQDLKDSASETIDNLADKASDLKDAASQKASKLKDAAGNVLDAAAEKASELKDVAAEKASDLKDSAAKKANEIGKQASNTAENIKDKASDIADEIADKASETLSDAADKAKKVASQAMESGQETLEALKEKANEIYSKFDSNGDDSISFEELKQAIQSSLGLEDEDEKSYTERLTELYNKYVKGEKRSVNKESFFNIFSDECKARKQMKGRSEEL